MGERQQCILRTAHKTKGIKQILKQYDDTNKVNVMQYFETKLGCCGHACMWVSLGPLRYMLNFITFLATMGVAWLFFMGLGLEDVYHSA